MKLLIGKGLGSENPALKRLASDVAGEGERAAVRATETDDLYQMFYGQAS
jgi:hypothetical protein